ncbi:MAG: choice-of-anchor V domain-containing protein [bacterium]
MLYRRRPRVAGFVVALVVGLAPAAGHAFSNGIASSLLGGVGCNACHSSGTTPSVILSGPTTVNAGDTALYTLTIFGSPAQRYGGLNVAGSTGVLSTGGPFATQTKTIIGNGGRVEITQSMPKQGDFTNVIEFSFGWTAPANFSGSATLHGWGNAVNLNTFNTGDAADDSSLIIVSGAPPPSPTATPTPGPDYCGMPATPGEPVLAADGAAQLCQRAIGKAGGLYVKKGLKAIQACLKTYQAGSSPNEPLALCAGTSAAGSPTDTKAAAALNKAGAKARKLLAAKCSDTALAGLDACATTLSGLQDCLITTHHQQLLDAVASQYGALAPTADKRAQKCQRAVASSAAALLNGALKASQKCLDARNKTGNTAPGAALCIAGAGGVPSDPKVAGASAKSLAALVKKTAGRCDNSTLAVLATCASNTDDLVTCLSCAQRSALIGLLAAEYGDD